MEFLGTQGDVWDTQEDMFMCLIGATCALLFMRPWQDRQLAKTEIESGSQESMNEKPKSSFHGFLINFSSA
jgi:hypothetical protein